MNRRNFLHALAALGASLALPADLASASAADIDTAWQAATEVWGLFQVSPGGTLSYANFEAQTRADAYGLPAAEKICVGDIEDCEPLCWHVVRDYSDILEQEPALCGEDRDAGWSEREAEWNWPTWFAGLQGEERDKVVASLRQWLAEEPDWGWEGDYLYETGDARGAAYHYFQDQDPDVLEALSITVIEGECPGSDYYAAELAIPPEEANHIAAGRGWSIRFVAEDAA